MDCPVEKRGLRDNVCRRMPFSLQLLPCYRACLLMLIFFSLAFLFYSRGTTFHCFGAESDSLTFEEKKDLIDRIFVDRKHKAFYCSVPKIGSTYMKRLFLLLSGTLKGNFLFNISTQAAHSTKPEQLSIKDLEPSAIYDKLKDYKKILVVRNPYKRLFSGYVDKFVGPNHLYHSTLGRQIIRMFRPNATAYSLRCGNDVTFTEFIKYFIYSVATGHLENPHFTPIYKLCHPCFFDYYIIKLENLTSEVPQLLNSLGVNSTSFRYLFQKDIQTEARLKDEIRHKLFLYYKNKDIISKCMTPLEVLRRLWIRDTIRGFIQKGRQFPLKTNNVKNLTRSQLFNIFKSAYRIPQAKKPGQAYNSAIKKAFLQVSDEDMALVQKYLETDCRLFGYNPKPKPFFKERFD